LSAQQDHARDREREGIHQLAAGLAGIEVLVGPELAPGHGSPNNRPRGSVIAEEGAFLEGLVARLIRHLLLAGQKQRQTDPRQHPPDNARETALPPLSVQLRILPGSKRWLKTAVSLRYRISDPPLRCKEKSDCGSPVRSVPH